MLLNDWRVIPRVLISEYTDLIIILPIFNFFYSVPQTLPFFTCFQILNNLSEEVWSTYGQYLNFKKYSKRHRH